MLFACPLNYVGGRVYIADRRWKKIHDKREYKVEGDPVDPETYDYLPAGFSCKAG